MDFQALLFAFSSTGFFTSRAFIPAFFTAVFLRYGSYFPFLEGLPFVSATGAEPTWFTSNYTILLLGALSIVEVAATKIPEAQDVLGAVHKYAKTAAATLVTMGVLQSRDASFIESTISMAGVLDMSISGVVGAAVFMFTTLRDDTLAIVVDSDPDDDLGIQSLISWFEDVWASFGIYFFIIYPIVILGVAAAFMGMLGLIKWQFTRAENKRKIKCNNCATDMYGSALACPSCKAVNSNPMAIGFFSQTTDKPVQDFIRHQIRLISHRRCSACASHLKEKKLPQVCLTCSESILEDPEIRNNYLTQVQSRLPKVLGISFLFSLIPVIGIIPGVIYYRVQLVAPFRAYIPPMRGFLMKWGLRFLFLFLISLQIIPFLGSVVVPIMALLSYAVYRRGFTSQLSA